MNPSHQIVMFDSFIDQNILNRSIFTDLLGSIVWVQLKLNDFVNDFVRFAFVGERNLLSKDRNGEI